MDDDAPRSASMPPAKATLLFARTVYRELRRANYERHELVRFLNDLMEMITTNLREAHPDFDRDLAGVVDPETGLPNQGTFAEIADFEIRSATGPGANLLMLIIEVAISEHCPDDLARRIHIRTANALRNCVRPGDTVARLSPNSYVLLLRRAHIDLAQILGARIAAVLGAGRRAEDAEEAHANVHYSMRATPLSSYVHNAQEMIEACSSSESIALTHLDRPIDPRRPTTSMSSAREKSRTQDAPLRAVLALGGGAVRAAAHIGVVTVLRDVGVEIVGIAGTSAGALIGAMMLSGMSNDAIIDRFETFPKTPLYSQMRRLYARYSLRARHSARTAKKYSRDSGLAFLSEAEISAVGDDILAEFIEYFAGPDRDIASLSQPFAATAMDIVEGRPVVFTRGPLHQALRASCAVPGLFAPQMDGPRMLIDGATTTEVPVAAALTLRRTTPTIAVHLARPASKINNYASSAEVLTRASSLTHTELVREQLRHAPVLITAPVGEIGWLDFRRARSTMELGALAAKSSIEQIVHELQTLAAARLAE